MEFKFFEIRDACTCIPALAIAICQSNTTNQKEDFLLRRSGIGPTTKLIYLIKLSDMASSQNPFCWERSNRTMKEAHLYIEKNFDILQSGEVIDVEFILGESPIKKTSEFNPITHLD